MALTCLWPGAWWAEACPTLARSPAVPRRGVSPLPTRSIAAIGFVGFCATFAEGASGNWSAIYIGQVTGAGAGVAAACFAVFASCMALARLGGNLVIRRFGPVATVRAGAVLATAGGVVVVAARAPALGIVGFALIGLGVAVVVPLVIAAAGNAAPTAGEGVAGATTITYLSTLVAPAVTGWIAGASPARRVRAGSPA